jgi:hypothetical protein
MQHFQLACPKQGSWFKRRAVWPLAPLRQQRAARPAVLCAARSPLQVSFVGQLNGIRAPGLALCACACVFRLPRQYLFFNTRCLLHLHLHYNPFAVVVLFVVLLVAACAQT